MRECKPRMPPTILLVASARSVSCASTLIPAPHILYVVSEGLADELAHGAALLAHHALHLLGHIRREGEGYVPGCGGHGLSLLPRGQYTVLLYFVGHMSDLVRSRLLACSRAELPFCKLPLFAT